MNINENYKQEFEIINLILSSDHETREVDAFTLSIVKMERQIRRIFTFLVFQNKCFEDHDISSRGF